MGFLLDRRAIEAALIAGGLATFALLERLPAVPLCVLKLATGVDCPTCGTTRAIFSLMHGDVAAAWAFNPVGIVVVAILLRRLVMLAANGRRVAVVGSDGFGAALLMLVFVFGVTHFLAAR
ncbi:MAG TPA: DUF2752 domain-containing protein [Thermoanaerobaculia bacterium]